MCVDNLSAYISFYHVRGWCTWMEKMSIAPTHNQEWVTDGFEFPCMYWGENSVPLLLRIQSVLLNLRAISLYLNTLKKIICITCKNHRGGYNLWQGIRIQERVADKVQRDEECVWEGIIAYQINILKIYM